MTNHDPLKAATNRVRSATKAAEAARRELEQAVEAADVDAIPALRTAALVTLPAEMADAQAALYDAKIADIESELQAIGDAPPVDEEIFAAARAAVAAAEAAQAAQREASYRRVELLQSRAILRAERDQLLEQALASRQEVARRLSGLDAEISEPPPVATDLTPWAGLPIHINPEDGELRPNLHPMEVMR